jgi:hypothetical protein
MTGLTTALLGRACRIFLDLAYPGGEQTIPPKKRVYGGLSPSEPLDTFLPPAPAATGIGQVLPACDGRPRGYAFRLGSAAFAHLKVQVVDYASGGDWVFAVDTHDALLPGLPPNHPDTEELKKIQEGNRELKEKIERAWEKAGLRTFNSLLRDGLDKPGPEQR